MGLKAQLQDDLTTAMRTGADVRRSVLRMVLAAVKEEEVAKGRDLDEGEVQAILMTQVKRRRETIADAEQAGREEMAAQEAAEITIIEDYLPEQMSKDEVRALAQEVISETGASSMKEMGQVMGRLMPRVKGRAEGHVVSDVVRELLQAR